MSDKKYAIRFRTKERKSNTGSIIDNDGDVYWICSGEYGIVPLFEFENRENNPPKNTKVFDSLESTNTFIQRLDHHNVKSFDIVEVKERYIKILDGYTIKGAHSI